MKIYMNRRSPKCNWIIKLASLLYIVERHRKEKINAGINRIGNLLPCSQALKQVRDMLASLFFPHQQHIMSAIVCAR